MARVVTFTCDRCGTETSNRSVLEVHRKIKHSPTPGAGRAYEIDLCEFCVDSFDGWMAQSAR